MHMSQCSYFCDFKNISQGEKKSRKSYIRSFRNNLHTLELTGISFLSNPSLKKIDVMKILEGTGTYMSKATTGQVAEANKQAVEDFKALCFLKR